jgi:RHS repeat-associated protein
MSSKTSGLATEYLSWDVSAALPLLLSDGQNSYIYGPNGLPVEQISSGEAPTYLHHDQLGSTRLLTNSSGETTATFSYGSYGAPVSRTGSGATPFGLAGQYTDSESGLQYLRARFYDPGTGLFLSRDPIVDLTREPYAYAQGNPLMFIDPSGRGCMSTTSIGGVVPVGVPDIGCVFGGGAEELIESPVTGPVLTVGCLLVVECTPVRALIAGVFAATSSNLLRSQNEPCYDFASNELEGLLILLAGAGPGGLVEAGSARAGSSLGLSHLGERILHIVTEAPGIGLDIVHGMTGS